MHCRPEHGILLAALLAGATACDRGEAPHEAHRDSPLPAALLPEPGALGRTLAYGPGAEPLVSAHRGGPGPGFPENAIETFERTIARGPALLECDIRRTADGELVLLHDESLERTTTGEGRLEEHTLAELADVRLESPDGKVTTFRLPTLETALAWSQGRAVLLLDVKEDVTPDEIVRRVRLARAENRVVVILDRASDLGPWLEIAGDFVYSIPVRSVTDAQALLGGPRRPSSWIAFLGAGGKFDPELVHLLHERGIRAIFGTFGEIDRLARRDGPGPYLDLLDQGIDILATDEPTIALEAAAAFERGRMKATGPD